MRDIITENNVKRERNIRLKEVFWIRDRHEDEEKLVQLGVLKQTTLTKDEYIKLLIYIQKLRELPQKTQDWHKPNFPENINMKKGGRDI